MQSPTETLEASRSLWGMGSGRASLLYALMWRSDSAIVSRLSPQTAEIASYSSPGKSTSVGNSKRPWPFLPASANCFRCSSLSSRATKSRMTSTNSGVTPFLMWIQPWERNRSRWSAGSKEKTFIELSASLRRQRSGSSRTAAKRVSEPQQASTAGVGS